MSETPIISPDARRAERIPPGQSRTNKWPVLDDIPAPPFDEGRWNFSLFPKPFVNEVKCWTWHEFAALPRTKVLADMHGVSHWTKLDNLWEGVATRELLNHATISEKAKFVMIHCEFGFTTNLPLEEFLREDCLFAMRHNGKDLEPQQGFPLRLVVPRLYEWKSAKWVRGVEFMEHDSAGFWESWEHGGYHMLGDPWTESRFRVRE